MGDGEVERGGRRVLGSLVVLGIVAAVVVGALVVREMDRRGRPTPEFASLVVTPDPTLHGTVAFISEAKDPKVKGRQACARVAAASGARAKDVYCWDIDRSALATAVWRDDGRLLVTSFQEPSGDAPLEPEWAKVVDVATGATEDVPDAELGEGAKPSTGPLVDPDGNRLSMRSEGGEATISVSGPSGSRTLLDISEANPDWSLQTGPVWSPDFDWVMTWDGRLLLTTATGAPTTRVLAEEASWSPYGVETPNFSILAGDRELP